MILIINVCKEKLHYYEFVKPIEDLVGDSVTKHYSEISDGDLEKADKVIICGTSLRDNEFLEKLEKFFWIKNFRKPLFGICAGMQIIGLVFGGRKREKAEIGFYNEFFEKEFLGLKSKAEVYHLHQNYCEFGDEFEIFSEGNGGNILQAVKHKTKPIYGVLFHPEVRNKEMILEFVRNG